MDGIQLRNIVILLRILRQHRHQSSAFGHRRHIFGMIEWFDLLFHVLTSLNFIIPPHIRADSDIFKLKMHKIPTTPRLLLDQRSFLPSACYNVFELCSDERGIGVNCMKLDLSCPIELRGYTLSYTDSAVQASVRLYNLTNRRIASFEAIAKWRSRTTDRGIAMPLRADRLRAGGENGFRINLSCDRQPDADQLDLVFTSVRFEDGGADWRAGEGMIVDVAPLEPISSADLEALRSLAGSDAVCFPKRDRQVWRCICGRTNALGDDACMRCHRNQCSTLELTRERVLAQYVPAETSTSAESEEALIANMHARYLRQRSRLLRRTVAMAIAALALTVLFVLNHQPVEAASANAEAASLYSE